MTKKGNEFVNLDDLRVVFKIISKNWYFFIILPALAWVLAYLYTSRLVDIYAAETQILVNPNESLDQSRVINAYSDFYRNQNNLTNQKRIINSYDLVQKTLNMLNFEVSYFIDGRLRTTELFGDAPFKVEVSSMSNSLFNKDFRLQVLNENSFILSYIKDQVEINKEFEFDNDIIDADFVMKIKNIQISKNNAASLSKIEYRFIPHNLSYLVSKYRSSIEIESESNTTILKISSSDEVPERAKMFLDTLAKNYIDYTVQTRIEVNDNTLLFIDKQLTQITNVLDSIEFELEIFKEDKAILDLSREESQYFEELSENEFRQREIRLKIETLNSLEEYIMNSSGLTFLPPSTYILTGDKFLTNSLETLYELEMQKISGLKSYTQDNKSFSGVNEQINLIKVNLLEYIISSRKAFSDQLKEIIIQGTEIEQLIKGVPKSQRELLNIDRKRQVNEKMYLFLLEKRANTIITKAAIVPDARIIQQSRNMGVIGPNRIGIYQKIIGAALFLASLITAIRFLFFSRIESVAELKSITDFPVLVGLPSMGKKFDKRLVVQENPKSNVAESFRALRTNLQFLGDAKRRQIMLTSSGHPSEGKTFTSVNLATIFALAGKNTVIVDFDLHKPKIHKTFDLKNDNGVSSIVAKGEPIGNCIQNSIIPNLDIITSGPIPPNASELVLFDKVAELINYCRENYDYVILDTPPIFLISDALQLMKYSDVNIIVANTENATKQSVLAIEEAVKVHEKRNVYFVLNNIRQFKWSYYYSKYGYKYGYGYGYGYGTGYAQNNE